ncbi:unnamed protein product [Vicia faba]|uniref:SEP domain-containing protein n=1 Tax=Vicia faba TaxID=3906 RepID=A0AAV0YKG6_VICFA|nr:unnamed protein product [Vicia faba]
MEITASVSPARSRRSLGKKASGSRQSGIRTLRDVKDDRDSGSGSESDEPQEYYAGGQKSGMLVQDPTRGGHTVDDIFDQARQIAFRRGGMGFLSMMGPLRRLEDPQNASFLESIKKSECPKELEPADRQTAVRLNLTRRNENYPEPVKPRNTAFGGLGEL